MIESRERQRRKRGSLSAEEIVDAALRILDDQGEDSLTFARLGTTLGSAPTAVYRHFASRDDLLNALGDRLDAISLAGYAPTDEWRTDLEDLAWRAWRVAIAHPAASALAMSRITNGVNELRAVDAILRALERAGIRGREAVLQYQVYANIVVGSAAGHGARLSGRGEPRTPEGWVQAYTPTDPTLYPYAEALKSELRLIDYETVFAKHIEMYLDALAVLADRADAAD
ncbi:TetR/AcrR family transcriptional regulator [Microbacterium sp. NPDC077184]|uniref:TetR/AcrR family transcriptional regulator n=1 Tax=Microbacterium sp. NPDC077184 TaxID=3154764 RepID=UPI00342DC412